MPKRTTIELDEELLDRAKQALNVGTTRATVEEALRRVVDSHDQEQAGRTARQVDFLRRLATHVDVEVYRSDEMWR